MRRGISSRRHRLLLSVLTCLFALTVFAQEPPFQADIAPISIPNLLARTPSADTLLPDVVPPPRPPRILKKPPLKYDLEKIGDRGIGKGMNFYSLDAEKNLGRGLSQQADMLMRLFDDPVIYEYVNRIGQNIARNSDIKVPLTVKIVSDDEVNAFSLPGGYLYITTGLLNEAETEAQVAGVIGHEVAHVSARHGTRTVSKGMLWSIILRAAAIATPGGRGAQIGKVIGADLASIMVFAKMERGAEDEADLLAVEYAYAAGYDPGEYVVFFEKVKALQKKKPSALGKIFASHPSTESRIEKVQRAIQDYLPDRPQYVVTTSSFEDLQARMNILLTRKLVRREDQDARPILRKRDTN